jgi:hypothetical protein
MADSINPYEGKITASNFLPRFYKTDTNKKFLQATLDQLIVNGTVKKVNGYIGRQNSKATVGSDIFLKTPTTTRQNYQLEPGMVIKDTLGNTTFFKDYQDYINQLGVFGANTDNHARINKQEFYSWDPHINWDKFIDFQNYYWLPYGPDVIKIYGKEQEIASEYTVVVESELDSNEYLFTPNGLTRNPTLKLFRGKTYTFDINSPGNPFSFKTTRTAGSLDRYITETLNVAAVEKGVITFTIPVNAPDILYYVSETDINLGGVIHILSATENSYIDVESELLGKKTYTLSTGVQLSNGMKLQFGGNVFPKSYASDKFYVEGVGTAIKLVKESTLNFVSSYTVSKSVPFESVPFDQGPFSNTTSYAGHLDYIVINRSSKDQNPWSRHNRWFHKDVINASATFNGKVAEYDQSFRAVRPIIEFEADLKLFNYGTIAVGDVDLVDTFTKDVFSTVEGAVGYNIDNSTVVNGQRILFTADTDSRVKNKIFKVEFVTVNSPSGSLVRQIHLVEETLPVTNQVILVKQGLKNSGQSYWFNGNTWNLTQQKIKPNQAPLFDVFDSDGVSYGDTVTYNGSTFAGTTIFSYAVGTYYDDKLGFNIKYKNINNFGDIVFNFDLLMDEFQYKQNTDVNIQNINVGYLAKSVDLTTVNYVNGWQLNLLKTVQAAVRIYKNSNLTNNFSIDIFDDITNLTDLVVRVYVNGIRVDSSKWSVIDAPTYKQVVFNAPVAIDDVVTIKTFARQPINNNGYYEIPINLQNNPKNGQITEFTLGEVSDHVNSIVDNLSNFTGTFPGSNNLRDLGNITPYGTKFVQHSGPFGLSLYHITSETNNIVKSLEKARDDYNNFKRNFIAVANKLGLDADPVRQVNEILKIINKDKPNTAPYYFSDMVPYGASIKNTYTVVDYRIKTYPLSTTFNLDTLSNKAVSIYLNGLQPPTGTQLLYGKDYTFDSQGFFVLSDTVPLQNDDTLTVIEFESTDGCFVPETPTKLGIWPKYEPKVYVDSSLVTPRTMIQGHDGSQVLAYGDFRDDLIIELEKRIFNNIKVEYNSSIYDIYDIVPSYNRTNDYSITEFNEVLAPSFYKWTALVDRDFTKPLSFDRYNPLTFNYRGHTAPDGREVPGYWRGIYRWLYDTDRPNICPWEMLGFTIQPSWWEQLYGPAPYTRDNLVMWQDISNGLVKEPGKPPVKLEKFAKPFLMQCIPVDSNGSILNPIEAGAATGIITAATQGDFVFGDVSPIEAAWRRSSHYPFSVMLASMLLTPAKTFGVLLDRSRIVRNLANQLIYKDTGIRVTPADIKLPNLFSSSSRVQTSGIINYLVNYILSDTLKSYEQYVYDLTYINFKLSYRVGGFTSKEKFNLLLDSRSPMSTGSVFVPQENYDIILNSSSPVKKITYSGVIITKMQDGFEVKGYTKTRPYFKYYPWIESGININIGGISEAFVSWTSSQKYIAGKIVKYSNKYYRTLTTHTSTSVFEPAYYQSLSSLPVVGGKNAYLRKTWDRTDPITVPFGTKFRTVQEVVDFLLGYGEYLKDQGFIFDDFNNALAQVTNWETSAKEFLFWTTQNWSSGQDKWDEWLPNTATPYEAIVRYNGDYYRAIKLSQPSPFFIEDDFVKLDGLSSIGSSVITLSPAAAKLTFSTVYCVVEDIKNQFNGYEIFKVDGTPIAPTFLNSYREDNSVSYTPRGDDGIYGASFYLVQREQVVVIDNTTMFNDMLYNLESGYKQDRIKVSGYVSVDWKGSFDVPGFIFDQAKINNWESWQDYALGDIVKHKEFFYSAGKFLPGTESFIATDWVKLDKTPTPKLIPNWNYKASQFEDFYSLDSDNFDVGQQKIAQHLIGYQKRQYLENIIQDDVSEFKFYQGMIIEKGTQNVLNKLFDVLSAENQESLKFYEEWALRVGQYGANGSYENIEFIINEALFKNNPQGFELVNTLNSKVNDFVIRQLPADVYLKPLGYNSSPWPQNKNYTPFLRTAGHVRADEVLLTLKSLDSIISADISKFKNSDCVWCTFDVNSWNVYRYTNTDYRVTSVNFSSASKQLTVVVDKLIKEAAGDYIGLDGLTGYSAFYKVISVTLNSMILSGPTTLPPGELTATGKAVISKFVSQRTSSIDNIDSIVPNKLVPGELVWVDDAGDGKWATLKYNPVYSRVEVSSPAPQAGLGFGKTIASDYKGSILATSTNNGELLIYLKSGTMTPWVQRSTISVPYIASGFDNSLVSTVLAISPNGRWLVTGTPLASNSKTSVINGLTVAVSTGTTSVFTNHGAITIYEKDINNIYNIVATVLSPSPASNELFGSSIVLSDVNILVGAPGTNKVYKLNFGTAWTYDVLSTLTGATGFGTNLSLSFDASTLAVSAIGQVTVYKDGHSTVLSNGSSAFGTSISLSYTGDFIAISDPLADGKQTDQGAVTVYAYNGTTYTVKQTLVNYNPETAELFGTTVKFMNDYKTLVVYTANADSVIDTTFDADQTLHPTESGNSTTLDSSATTIITKKINGGRVDIYDLYSTKWVYSESLENLGDTSDRFAQGLAVFANGILVGAPATYNQNLISGKVYFYTKDINTYTWSVLHKEINKPDVFKIKRAFIYNKPANKLLTYLDVVDPIQGKIPGIAEKEIKFKTFYDPAIYSVGSASVNVDEGMAWSINQVGALWWDLRTAKFVNSYDTDIVYRNSTWNTLAVGASIDVYEWAQSSLKPSEWDAQADTEAGVAIGISGKTLYGDTVYSTSIRYDSISKSKKTTYYYWVKNKKTIPALPFRNMSAQDVANIIANPRGEGYKYLALTGLNSFSLVNVKSLLSAEETILSVEYWTVDKIDQNVHTQWAIISEDSPTLPATIEQKWFDSLCGKDSYGRQVPDITLPIKLRYGVENRPRQSMFVNRFEALKQLVEQANLFLIEKQIVTTRNISALNRYDAEPKIVTVDGITDVPSGLYDKIIDTDAELNYTNFISYQKPNLEPIIVNGRITGVNIISKGAGYIYAPYITIHGSGVNANIRTIINEQGQIIGANIISSGTGYDSNTLLIVRDFSVLVHSDSQAAGAWSIYSYDPTNNIWSRIVSQTYDVRNYWKKVDWYATGYSQFTAINIAVNTLVDLQDTDIKVGEVVKVKTTNNGTWLLLEKYSNIVSVDWTLSYKVVGIENGTIQLTSNLYKFVGSNVGYDAVLYDGGVFDNVAANELKIILNALRDDILVDDLKSQYLNLFFTSVRYALSEQLYIDWIFKTSFVKSKHLVGDLHQAVTFKNDNLSNFEDYISEVTPYRTKIREFISSYTKIDNSQSVVTDFDLPPTYNAETDTVSSILTYTSNAGIEVGDSAIRSYPWKNWFDNVGFKVTDIKIVDGGTGYISQPVVKIVGTSRTPASATAYIANGKVNRVVLVTSGDGYLKAPTILLDGGLSSSGIAGRAVAIISDGTTRSSLIKMKFDRITSTYFITQLQETETFTGIYSKKQFPLTWAPNTRIGQSSVTINGVEVLRDDYTLSIVKSTSRGYTSYSGSLIFNTAPLANTSISITYLKDWSLLNAADRIQYYYNPTTGQLGKDLSQLMTGIDYGGVIVNSLGFDLNYGWGAAGWYTDRWDSYDSEFDDYIKTVDGSTHSFTLPYVPDSGTVLNIYYSKVGTTSFVRLDDPYYGTVNQTNVNAIMMPVIADGTLATVTIPGTFAVSAGDSFIIRKITSDGSLKFNELDYDTALSGGELAEYSSATGLRADDIIVDGDEFNSQITNSGPEEVVPGQVIDSVAIKVYDRLASGSANIHVDNYFANGTDKIFPITQTINSNQAAFVKINSVIKNLVDDYSIDYKNKSIVFVSAPAAGSLVSIFSFGFSGSNILDVDYFIADGVSAEFITKAPWVSSVKSLVYINGIPVNVVLFKTDNTYDTYNRIGIRFSQVPVVGDVINFIIVSGSEQTFSITKTEKISANGSLTYILQNQIGNTLPAEANMIVRVNQTILKGPDTSYFTIKSNRLNYQLHPVRFPKLGVDANRITVYAAGELLAVGYDYIVDLTGITIKINKNTYAKYSGKTLSVVVSKDNEYTYNSANNSITFATAYTSGDRVEVTSFYKHDVLGIQRSNFNITVNADLVADTVDYFTYKNLLGGTFPLERAVIGIEYVWVTKNNQLLTQGADYKLLDDMQTIVLTVYPTIGDVYSVITYGSNVLKPGIAYMQFKDMLNRVHYKRLNFNKRTYLSKNLKYGDLTIEVVDGSILDYPSIALNTPGVIEIRGERIEYFTKTGNVLGQLRRGTLGTGTPLVHNTGSYVQDIGRSETVPYIDTASTEQIVSDGTTIVPISFAPASVDEIEVFVGGYDTTTIWEPATAYIVDTIVNHGSYMFRCITAHTSSTTFNLDSAKWKLFVGNIRLQKKSYSVFNINNAPESPEGDVILLADFTVDGTSKKIILTNKLITGTLVTVIKKSGVAWDDSTNIMESTGKIAEFINAQPGVWYTDMKQVSVNTVRSFDSGLGTFDSSSQTFDQGN